MNIEEFLERYAIAVPESGCWIWTRDSEANYGYGAIWFRKKVTKAHRVAYTLAYGEIPPNLIVRHTCDVPACVNPKHLLIGTKNDNTQDAVRRNRFPVGERRSHSKLTTADVLSILADKSTSNNELAKRFGVHNMQISRIRRGLRWGHLSSASANP